MIFNENEWEKITNYLKLQIKEYCAKNTIDLEDFSKRLGLSYRVLSRLYSSKSSGERNNRFLSSLEFLYSLAKALEIDLVKMIYEINSLTDSYNELEKEKEKNTSKITDRIKLIKVLNKEIVKIFNNPSNRIERRNKLPKYLNLAIIFMFLKKTTMQKIIAIIETDGFNELSKTNKETLTQYLKSTKNEY